MPQKFRFVTDAGVREILQKIEVALQNLKLAGQVLGSSSERPISLESDGTIRGKLTETSLDLRIDQIITDIEKIIRNSALWTIVRSSPISQTIKNSSVRTAVVSTPIQRAVKDSYLKVRIEPDPIFQSQLSQHIKNSSIHFKMSQIQHDSLAGVPSGSYTHSQINNRLNQVVQFLLSPHVIIDEKIEEKVKDNVYKDIASIYWPGKQSLDIQGMNTNIQVKSISYVEKNTIVGSLRLKDFSTGTTLAEKTDISNTNEAIIDIPVVSSFPQAQALLKVQAKRNSGPNKKIVVKNISIIAERSEP